MKIDTKKLCLRTKNEELQPMADIEASRLATASEQIRHSRPAMPFEDPFSNIPSEPPVQRVEVIVRSAPAETAAEVPVPVDPGEQPPLDRWRADAVLEGERKIWGLEAIAAFLGVSSDTVRRWKNDPAVSIPVSRPAGTYFAFRSELVAWLKES